MKKRESDWSDMLEQVSLFVCVVIIVLSVMALIIKIAIDV